MTDKMREEFIEAFVQQFGFGRMAASSNPDAAGMLACAEWAWFASRAALRDHLRLSVSAMPRDRLRETFNAAYYGPRELGSDGEQCRAGVLAVIEAAMGKGGQS